MEIERFVRRTLTIIQLYEFPTGKCSFVYWFFMDMNPLTGNLTLNKCKVRDVNTIFLNHRKSSSTLRFRVGG